MSSRTVISRLLAGLSLTAHLHGAIAHASDRTHRTLADVKRNSGARGAMILGRSDVANHVEEPLVQACEKLWDLGIETTASTLNAREDNLKYGGTIAINFETLSPENRKIALDLARKIPDQYEVGKAEGQRYIVVRIPAKLSDSVPALSLRALLRIRPFKQQPMNWLPHWTFLGVRDKFYPPGRTGPTPQHPSEVTFPSHYHDKEGTGLYFLSREHANRYRQSQRVPIRVLNSIRRSSGVRNH